MSFPKHIVIVTDGDADYTDAYEAPTVVDVESLRALEATLPEDDGDYFYRVIPLSSFEKLQARLAGEDDY